MFFFPFSPTVQEDLFSRIFCLWSNVYFAYIYTFLEKEVKSKKKKYVEATNTTYFNIKIICLLKKRRKAIARPNS